MAFYDYKCTVNECKAEFTVERDMSQHKDFEDCPYCESKAAAKQVFLPSYQPNVKVYQNKLHKHITFDRE